MGELDGGNDLSGAQKAFKNEIQYYNTVAQRQGRKKDTQPSVNVVGTSNLLPLADQRKSGQGVATPEMLDQSLAVAFKPVNNAGGMLGGPGEGEIRNSNSNSSFGNAQCNSRCFLVSPWRRINTLPRITNKIDLI